MQGNPDSQIWEIFIIESGILGFGIQNPTNVLNPESTSHWQWVESIKLESGIHGGESRIQEGLGFLHFFAKMSIICKN